MPNVSQRNLLMPNRASNILMERIICAAGIRHSGTIFYKSVMPLAYANDVDIIDRSDREVVVAFYKYAEKARNIGLAVN